METNSKFKAIILLLFFFIPTIANALEEEDSDFFDSDDISIEELDAAIEDIQSQNDAFWEEIVTARNNSDENADDENKLETNENEQPQSITHQLVDEFSDRAEVEKFRNFYLQNPKRLQQLYEVLENATEYRLYVKKAINDRNLPEELEYLPIVESNYKANAKSKSGALGLWQFMSNSVKPFLVLNEYVDERLDPWKSTDAGLSKLEYNYKTFNDWLLALAAYNCGNGAMTKAIKKGDSTDFWYLAENGFLPSQTKEYIPKLIAIADLVINAEKYEIDFPNIDEEYELFENNEEEIFDFIEVSKAYSLSSIAREMKISEATLKKLNPSLLKGFTPPAAKFKLRLPLGTLENAKTAIASIEPIEFPFKYKVVAGDSLWSISRRFGVTVKALCDTNGIEENAILKIGKILYIPSK